MKFSKSDFLLIRWNLLGLCASLLICALALYSSGEYAEKTQRDLSNSQRQLNDARSRLRTAYEDRENMEIYASEYGALIDRKIIGDDHRLDWIEGLEQIRRQNLNLDSRYSIGPQKIYARQPGIDSGNYEIHYSETRMQFELLHEGQLLDFFAALRKQIKGHYQLEGCTLARTTDSSVDAAAAHISAECNGGWITLKNRNAPL